jgi:exosortase/archaeosortase family protein
MSKQKNVLNNILFLFLRYLLIIILGLGNLAIIYTIFTPITIKSVYFMLSIFSSAKLVGNTIIFNGFAIQLIPACIAGSAYYLLSILVLSTFNIKISKRILAALFSILSLLVLNILRIVLLALITKSAYFNSVHMLFWYVLSTIFVIGIWILTVKLFNIKSVPVYSDIKYILNLKKTK